SRFRNMVKTDGDEIACRDDGARRNAGRACENVGELGVVAGEAVLEQDGERGGFDAEGLATLAHAERSEARQHEGTEVFSARGERGEIDARGEPRRQR